MLRENVCLSPKNICSSGPAITCAHLNFQLPTLCHGQTGETCEQLCCCSTMIMLGPGREISDRHGAWQFSNIDLNVSSQQRWQQWWLWYQAAVTLHIYSILGVDSSHYKTDNSNIIIQATKTQQTQEFVMLYYCYYTGYNFSGDLYKPVGILDCSLGN